jgi:plastocyanin
MSRTLRFRLFVVALFFLAGVSLFPQSAGRGLVDAQELDLHPAHTHTGSCVQPGPIVSTLSPVSNAYVVDGESMVVPEIVGSAAGIPVEYSSTTLPVPLSQILAGQFIVDVKVSESDQINSVACGEIGGLMLGATDLPIGLVPVGDSGHYGTAWLHDNGDGTTNLSIALIDVGGAPAVTSGATIPVSIQNFAFEPATITARAGDTIVFTNNDASAHTVTQNPSGSGFQSAPIDPGTTYTLTIDEPGTYPFFCEFHPGMTGTILASE